MQVHEPKSSTTRSTAATSTQPATAATAASLLTATPTHSLTSYSSSGSLFSSVSPPSQLSSSATLIKSNPHCNNNNNNQVSSSESNKIKSKTGGSNSNNNFSLKHNISGHATEQHQSKRAKKKFFRDRRSANDEKSESVMSNLSSYSLIDDDHIDDQETINVGNLIIDLESDLEKEKIENEQANYNVNLETNAKISASNSSNVPSSTSNLSSSTSNKHTAVNKPQSIDLDQAKAVGRVNQKSGSKKEIGSINTQSTHTGTINNNGLTVSSRTVFKSSADERGELKMKITREMKPVKNEHKFVTSPNQKSPTSSSGGTIGTNLNLNSHINSFENSNANQLTLNPKQSSSSISSTKECGTSTSIGTITEPDCLGPCEPGTSVTLEGIVWQETDGGILVVNVTWRGKTYVGALLDCTRHDWAPPRLCDSPASDIDAKTSKGMRTKRIVTRSNGTGLDEKNLLQTTGKLRNGKGRRIPTSNDIASCSKKQRETTDKSSSDSLSAQPKSNASQASMSVTNSETASIPMTVDAPQANDNNNVITQQQDITLETGNTSLDKTRPDSPMLIGCSEPNCSKKYRNTNGLMYHKSHAHSADTESPQDDQEDSSNLTSEKEAPVTIEEPSPTDRVSPGATNTQVTLQKPTSKHEEQQHSQQLKSPTAPQKQYMAAPTSKPSSFGSPKPVNLQPPLPVPSEEGMKPSGTSTGPPPAPHQANCYFNASFMANNFNPYMPPYFPRHMFDPMTPPSIPAPNPAYMTRLMNNIRVPQPPESPSRLLSPSMPKNLPYNPFKIDSSAIPPPPPPQIPTSHPLQNLSPMSNPPVPMTGPPVPPLSMGVCPPNLRMPSHGDPMMPPTSQPPFFPRIPGMGNPLGPLGNLMTSIAEDSLSKQFPRRFN